MGTLRSYIIGFILSLALTAASFYIVANHSIQGKNLIFAIFGLALVQLLVQLIYFLHLGSGKDRLWSLMIFASTISIILIIVIGSLVIMNNLNYNHMTAEEMNQLLLEKEGIYK